MKRFRKRRPPPESAITGPVGTGSRNRRGARNRAIATLAARHQGMVRRASLLEAGVGESAIRRRLQAGSLRSIYPGVLSPNVGPLARAAEAAAAVLACGVGALLSHRSAAELWGLIEWAAANAWHVTVPGRKLGGPSPKECIRRGLRPIKPHYTRGLWNDESTIVDGVPITSVPRTLIDFAAHATNQEVAHAYEQALIMKLTSREQVRRAVDRHRGRRGLRVVRALLERDAPPSVTLSHAERVLVELLHESGLEGFQTNAWAGPYRVDVLWPDERVIVEVDGAAFHSTDARREADTRRDAELAARGFVVLRITWRELRENPQRAIARISRTLALRRS